MRHSLKIMDFLGLILSNDKTKFRGTQENYCANSSVPSMAYRSKHLVYFP
jgi:hypothetical protein